MVNDGVYIKNIVKDRCRVCGEHEQKLLFAQGKFEVIRCIKCGFGTLRPIPTEKELLSIYQGDYHQYLEDEDFLADARKKYNFLKPYLIRGDKVLDVGCGLGHLLSIAQEDGMEVLGYDVSLEAAKMANKRYGVDVVTKKFEKKVFEKKSFAMISLFDVIEHIVQFKKTIGVYQDWLVDDGILVMTTPDIDAWDARLMGKKWYGYTRIPQHINYFNRNSIKLVLEELGFEVVECRLWGFVRSLEYIARTMGGGEVVQKLVKIMRLYKYQIYLPMIDMIIVARKVSH